MKYLIALSVTVVAYRLVYPVVKYVLERMGAE